MKANVTFLTLDYKPCPPDEKPARFAFQCPRTGKTCSDFLINGAELAPGIKIQRGKTKASVWDFNGDKENPTFSPSILCYGCEFHGYIKNGEIVDA